jgi:hypothetical protein
MGEAMKTPILQFAFAALILSFGGMITVRAVYNGLQN